MTDPEKRELIERFYLYVNERYGMTLEIMQYLFPQRRWRELSFTDRQTLIAEFLAEDK